MAAAGYSAHKAQHISISAGQGENCQSIMYVVNIFYGIRAEDLNFFHYQARAVKKNHYYCYQEKNEIMLGLSLHYA